MINSKFLTSILFSIINYGLSFIILSSSFTILYMNIIKSDSYTNTNILLTSVLSLFGIIIGTNILYHQLKWWHLFLFKKYGESYIEYLEKLNKDD